MRLWTLSPSYIDQKGLVALWREGLGAKKALEKLAQKEKFGYQNHPQLIRFKQSKDPLAQINKYLFYVLKEAESRGYNFDGSKLDLSLINSSEKIIVTSGQIDFEVQHLKNKLEVRNKELLHKFNSVKKIEIIPIFKIVKGDIEAWEKV